MSVSFPPDVTVINADSKSNGNMLVDKGTEALCSIRGFKEFFHLLPLKRDRDVVDYILDIICKCE